MREPRLAASSLRRFATHLRTRGTAATVKRVAAEVAPRMHLHETHAWYELDLTTRAPAAPPWPAGVELVAGGAQYLAHLDELDAVDAAEASRRLDADAQWWLVLDGEQPLFSCWVFHHDAPVLAAPAGRLALPPGTVVLEDSVTAPVARGRGIAPRAWSAIATDAAAYADRMVTKVEIANTPSRRAVSKAGFVQFAAVDYCRVGARVRVRVQPVGGTAGWLADVLGDATGAP